MHDINNCKQILRVSKNQIDLLKDEWWLTLDGLRNIKEWFLNKLMYSTPWPRGDDNMFICFLTNYEYHLQSRQI